MPIKNTAEDNQIFPDTRLSMLPPKRLVNDGLVTWGSFSQALPVINLLDSKDPLGLPVPSFLKALRLKEWEAFQVDSSDFFVLGAIYQTGLCAFNILSVWNKKDNSLQTWQSYAPGWQLKMADNLLASENVLHTRSSELTIQNQLTDGTCLIQGNFRPKKQAKTAFQFNLKCCSEPSVMSMPLGPNRGLYTHKALFEASGFLQIGDQRFECKPGDLAIIDDHKGFYPYKLHYDWVTGFQRLDAHQTLAFNLTKNQVTDPQAYNENWLWVNGVKHPLPPVEFNQVSAFVWKIKDLHGLVDLEMEIVEQLQIKQQLIVASADYRAVFGVFKGKLKDSQGQWHAVNEVYGMGEDKTYRM